MIKSFKITNYLGDSIEMDIRKPEDTGFLIATVSGLTLPNAQIGVSDVAGDGAKYSGARIEKRNIVFGIIFYEDNNALDPDTNERRKLDVEEMRHKCYRYFPIKKKLTVEVTNDSGTYSIDGYVESNETAIFTKQEGAQISILCPDPYFKKTSGSNIIKLSDVVGAFEFPVTIENPIEFGIIKTTMSTDFYYDGSPDTGLTIRLRAANTVTNPIIYDLKKHRSMKILTDKLRAKTGTAFVAKDEIIITTGRGNKSVTLLRDGVKTSIIQCLDKNSKWIMLDSGPNSFGFSADSGRSYMFAEIEYSNGYLGV